MYMTAISPNLILCTMLFLSGYLYGSKTFCTVFLNVYPVNLQHARFSIKVENSVDPDQLASSEAS